MYINTIILMWSNIYIAIFKKKKAVSAMWWGLRNLDGINYSEECWSANQAARYNLIKQ